ncbi:MAG: B-box zinc finger protein [Chloroflexota bacterium]|nr:B-box zinc finger protein [Chloroflexota bacterium]MDE2941273.1 B-box zinc finger protein [Chloroflexota bacterium]MDE3267793.1 B-box zinc finger protein [Chloroflexota bacterium]
MAGPEATYCARHPRVESRLGCSRCGTLICPRCLVQSDVGARCPDCARVTRLPTFQLDGLTITKAVITAVVIAGSTGAAWGLLFFRVFSIPYLPWLVLLGIGFLTGEAISVSTNRKRGRLLQYIAAAGVVASYAVASVLAASTLDPLVVRFLAPGLFTLLAIGVGAYIAASRVG